MGDGLSEETRTVLAGDDAVNLWLQGKDAWNKWVEENPEADVDFSNVDFEEIREHRRLSRTSFSGFNFPNGRTSFIETKFGSASVLFDNAQFGDKGVSFYRADFGGNRVSFVRVFFGGSELTFSRAAFGDADVFFSSANLENCIISFMNAHLGNGNVSFYGAKTSDTSFFFDSMNSSSFIDLRGIANSVGISRLSFFGATINGNLVLPRGLVNCVPDLQNTKIAKAISFHDIIPTLKRTEKKWWEFWKVRTAIYKDDASRFRRLKELAEINRDHQAALTYHANELRALRWVKSSIPASILDAAFSWASDYGQSVWRPIRAFLIMDLFFFGFYVSSSNGNWIEAAKIVAANSLPFLTYSRVVQTESIQAMYGNQIPNCVTALTFAQGIGSVIFLFLLGLGLRNRFRI